MEEFLKRCFYHSGQYNSEEHFAELDVKLKQKEGGKVSNRLFYLSIPPDIFVDVARCASGWASSKNGWTRVIVEKPFGRDAESSGELTRSLKKYLAEEQIFRKSDNGDDLLWNFYLCFIRVTKVAYWRTTLEASQDKLSSGITRSTPLWKQR